MSSFSKISNTLFVLLLFCTLTNCANSNNQNGNDESKNTIIVVKYKAQPDKGIIAVTELTKLIEQVKLEPHFISIKVHVDPKDDTNILLYEEWADENYFNTEHMNTSHLKSFIANSKNFLVGPPDISSWRVENTFE